MNAISWVYANGQLFTREYGDGRSHILLMDEHGIPSSGRLYDRVVRGQIEVDQFSRIRISSTGDTNRIPDSVYRLARETFGDLPIMEMPY